jgi:hypothetical protein
MNMKYLLPAVVVASSLSATVTPAKAEISYHYSYLDYLNSAGSYSSGHGERHGDYVYQVIDDLGCVPAKCTHKGPGFINTEIKYANSRINETASTIIGPGYFGGSVRDAGKAYSYYASSISYTNFQVYGIQLDAPAGTDPNTIIDFSINLDITGGGAGNTRTYVNFF